MHVDPLWMSLFSGSMWKEAHGGAGCELVAPVEVGIANGKSMAQT
jgi:hypothetical protein